MDDSEKRKAKSGHRGRHKGFWRAWRDQWAVPGEDRGWPGHHPAMHMEMKGRMWREFFFEFMGTWPEQHWAFGGRRFSPWMQGDLEFNPFLASVMSKGGGLLPLIVLDLLAQRPLYGNEIMDLISRKTSGGWMANPGAIYPLLTMMESQGLVKGKWEDPRKRTKRFYEITVEGQEELSSLRAILKPRLEEAVQVLKSLLVDLEHSSSIDPHEAE